MSQGLLNIAKEFVAGKIDAEKFCEEFFVGWKTERNAGQLSNDSVEIGEILSTIFCLTDLYNPDDDREEYEYDADRLRAEVGKTLS
jgi:hypothetical protein